MSAGRDPDVERWYAALEERHLASLTLPEVRRALQALSSLYVERRGRLGRRDALAGRGKRAAFALFYAPLHFLVVRAIVRELGAAAPAPSRVVDLGSGTGAGGAAWACEAGRRSEVTGIDRNGWAIGEAQWNARALGLRAAFRRGDLSAFAIGAPGEAIVAAYTVNELDDAGRAALLPRLLAASRAGSRVLVVEPIAKAPTPFWTDWSEAVGAAGGRDDAWRLPATLPDRMALLDRAAGLDHRVLTARSLFLPGARD
jgi:hypothetical protein